jgi:hypothetical protein
MKQCSKLLPVEEKKETAEKAKCRRGMQRKQRLASRSQSRFTARADQKSNRRLDAFSQGSTEHLTKVQKTALFFIPIPLISIAITASLR